MRVDVVWIFADRKAMVARSVERKVVVFLSLKELG